MQVAVEDSKWTRWRHNKGWRIAVIENALDVIPADDWRVRRTMQAEKLNLT
jgi:hypothetical protein